MEQEIIGRKMASEIKELKVIQNRLTVQEGELRAELATKEAILEDMKKDGDREQGKFTLNLSDLCKKTYFNVYFRVETKTFGNDCET